jgi:PAS domain S-box-containing protein
MKEMKGAPRAPREFSSDGADGAVSKNGAPIQSATAPVFHHPKTELEAAIQRYVDLFDFAPIAYVSFDRVGHIEEINLATAQLLGARRDRLIGAPFALYVTKEDAGLFLSHLLHCRSSDSRVETELHLKKRTGEIILAHLASSPMTSSMRDGALLYQTAIVDLSERKRAEEAIRESEQRYRTLFDLVPVAVYTCDAAGLIQEFNQRAAELWGRDPEKNDPAEKFCGSFKIFYPDGKPMPHDKCPMARALRGERLEGSDLEIVVERSNGARRNVLVSPTALKNQRGKIIGAINCLHDITVRKRMENALRESEERSRAIVNQTTAGIVGSDLTGRIIFVNRKFSEMLGYKESALVGKTILAITHPDDVAESRRLFRRIVSKAEPYELEKRYVRKDGSSLWASVSASPMRNAAGKTQSAVAVIIDITDRKKAQAILEERTRGLEGEILAISDREQRRLGQDLHDSLCQHLTAVAFMARSVALRLKNHRVLEVNDIEKIAELINEGVTEARTIARGLHPVEMDPAGLATALRSLLNRQSKLPYRLDMDEEISIPDPTVALHLYRIAREAVINANKHARAREIIVRMHSVPKGIELSVTDDGIGIPPNFGKGSGMGFHIMEYRARSIGAGLEIKRIKPHGTRVACHVPRQ